MKTPNTRSMEKPKLQKLNSLRSTPESPQRSPHPLIKLVQKPPTSEPKHLRSPNRTTPQPPPRTLHNRVLPPLPSQSAPMFLRQFTVHCRMSLQRRRTHRRRIRIQPRFCCGRGNTGGRGLTVSGQCGIGRDVKVNFAEARYAGFHPAVLTR